MFIVSVIVNNNNNNSNSNSNSNNNNNNNKVSSAYLHSELPGEVTASSAELTTYDAGPIAEPWMMLAEISTRAEVSP